MKIIIKGDVPPSKKNSKQIFYRNGKPFISTSKRYKEWHERASWQLAGKTNPKVTEHITIVFHPKTKRKFDLSNKAESILDLLVDVGMLEDDNYLYVPKLTLEIGEQDKINPRTIIEL